MELWPEPILTPLLVDFFYLKAKQRRSLCFAFVCDSTENTGFLKFCRFYCVFQWKSNQSSSKIHKMTFCMQKSMCKKVTNFKSLKVSKLMTLKWKYLVNNRRNAGYLQNIFIQDTSILGKRLLISWHETSQAFLSKKRFKNVKNQVVKWLFSLKGLILFTIFWVF